MQRSDSNSSFEDNNNNNNSNKNVGQLENELAKTHLDATLTKDVLHISCYPRRRPSLQRQSHTSDEDYVPATPDENDYAADMEEEEEEDNDYDHYKQLPENDLSLTTHNLKNLKSKSNYSFYAERNLATSATMPSSASAVSSLPKHIQFQKHKPHSTTALLKNNACRNTSNILQHSSSVCSVGALSDRLLLQGESFDSVPSSLEFSPSLLRYGTSLHHLQRDNSIHSDSSRYSSVDSLLESRKPDPEAILINLGFGPAIGSDDILSRIPKRFLKPSQVRGIDTEAFVKRIQLASSLADHSALGYRGLTGNPDVPPSSIVAKIMHRFEVNERKKSMGGSMDTMR